MDILERLGNFHIGTTIDDLVGDAAKEIRRLRALVKEFRRERDRAVGQDDRDELDAAEKQRLGKLNKGRRDVGEGSDG